MATPDVFDERRRADKEKSALENLFPDSLDLPDRIKLIGTLRGTPPTISALYEARVVFDLLDMMDGKKDIEIWHELSMSKFYEERTPSLGGKHADRAVQIAQAAPRQEIPLSWLERLMGKGK
jgi:hypothetical protein